MYKGERTKLCQQLNLHISVRIHSQLIENLSWLRKHTYSALRFDIKVNLFVENCGNKMVKYIHDFLLEKRYYLYCN